MGDRLGAPVAEVDRRRQVYLRFDRQLDVPIVCPARKRPVVAGRPDPPRGQQHVDAPAGAQVQDALAFVEVGDCDRIATAERGHDGGIG